MSLKNITYIDAVSEIKNIISEIESDEVDIDLLSEKVNIVASLIKICKEKLHKTEKETEKTFNEIITV